MISLARITLHVHLAVHDDTYDLRLCAWLSVSCLHSVKV